MSTNNRLRDLSKSRALTTGFKLFLGLAAFALAAAFITGFQSCRPNYVGWQYPLIECTGDQGLVDSILGAMTFGWKGGVGNLFVYTTFVSAAALSLVLGGLMLAFRDADPASVAEAARTDQPPVVNPPTHLNFWPILAAFSVATMMIGLVVNQATFVAGLFALFTCGVMWMLRSWADRATGDPDANEEVHERIAFGLEIPLAAGVLIAVIVASLSRVMLTVDATTAWVLAGAASALIFFIGTAIAYFPRINRNAVSALLVCGAFIVIGAGVVSAAQGERSFEESEHLGGGAESDHGESDDGDDAESGGGDADHGESDDGDAESGGGDADHGESDATTTTASDSSTTTSGSESTTTTAGSDATTTTVTEGGTN